MSNPRLGDLRRLLPAVAGFGIPFVLIVYLALEAGGYDLIVRSQVGIIIWWVVLLGVVAGLLPLTHVTRSGWIGFGVFCALALWTAIAMATWTESTERSMVELSRVSMLLGALLLFLLLQGRESLRRSVSAVGVAVGVIALIALASRLQPDWFPASDIPQNFPVSRLSYPLEYWNGLAALVAIGLPLLVWMAASGRSLVGRGLAAAAIPVAVLVLYLTASRGGAIEAAVALLALIVLFPKRLVLLPTVLIAGLGSGLLLVFIEQRPELRDRVQGELAASQGSEMIWLTLGVVALVAAAQYMVGLAMKKGKLVVPTISRRIANWFGIASGIVVALVVVLALGSGFVGDRWDEFKVDDRNEGNVSRLGNLNSGERYKVWDSAVDASASEPWIGIGPGTFEYWWAREGTGSQFMRDAHSLYLESLAELGPLGLLLVLAIVLVPTGLAASGAIRRGSDERRSLLAAAAASMLAFSIAAGVDWVLEMTVLPVVFIVLAASVLGPSAQSRKGRKYSRFRLTRLDWKKRGVLGVVSAAALVVIALPLAGTTLIRESQESFRHGETREALDQAERAIDIQPYSASALIQRSLVLIETDRPAEAVRTARKAVEAERGNWRTWYALSKVAEVSGNYKVAKSAWQKAELFNPKSVALTQ